jgi:hypothetical protein
VGWRKGEERESRKVDLLEDGEKNANEENEIESERGEESGKETSEKKCSQRKKIKLGSRI